MSLRNEFDANQALSAARKLPKAQPKAKRDPDLYVLLVAAASWGAALIFLFGAY
jgi:hypothetical protein